MVSWLASLTGVAGSDVVIHECSHTWPMEISLKYLQGLGLTRVSDFFDVVGLVQEANLKRFIVGDVNQIVVVKDLVAAGEVFHSLLESVVTIFVGIVESVEDLD